MAKISIKEAVKRYDVSRPTVFKHLKTGKISGEKDPVKGWQIDPSELARVYDPRTTRATVPEPPPEDELARLRRELAVAQAIAEERGAQLERLDKAMRLIEDKREQPSASSSVRGFIKKMWRSGAK